MAEAGAGTAPWSSEIVVDWEAIIPGRVGVCSEAHPTCAYAAFYPEGTSNVNESKMNATIREAHLVAEWEPDSEWTRTLHLGLGSRVHCPNYCDPYGSFRVRGVVVEGESPLELDAGTIEFGRNETMSMFVWSPFAVKGPVNIRFDANLEVKVTGRIALEGFPS